MLSVKGKFKDGVALPDTPVKGRDDQEVIITFLDQDDAAQHRRDADLLHDWQAASNRSLQEVWDNDEDAAYDEL